MRTPLIVVGGTVRQPTSDYGDASPRVDFLELARVLNARLISAADLSRTWSWFDRWCERSLRIHLPLGVAAARWQAQHSLLLSLSEKTALPIAARGDHGPQAIPHVAICHRLSSRTKSALFRVWPLQHRLTRLICLCRAQAEYAQRVLGVAGAKIVVRRVGVDDRFFAPAPDAAEDYVLAVGYEQRDYALLLRALSGTGMRAILVPSSRWARTKIALPDDVSAVFDVSDMELRRLYAGARVVVVPLQDNDYSAGVNALLEAMAMGKPVIATHTSGLADYVRPGDTALCVPPGDWQAMGEAIGSLWEHAARRRELGANARQFVVEHATLDQHVADLAAVVRDVERQHHGASVGATRSVASVAEYEQSR